MPEREERGGDLKTKFSYWNDVPVIHGKNKKKGRRSVGLSFVLFDRVETTLERTQENLSRGGLETRKTEGERIV